MDTNERRVEILHEVLSKLDECAGLLETLLPDPLAYELLPEFEGRDGGWHCKGQPNYEYMRDRVFLELVKRSSNPA